MAQIQFNSLTSCQAMKFWFQFWLIKNTSEVLIWNIDNIKMCIT